MLQQIRYQTTLAQLGWFLLGEDAFDIEIDDEGIFLSVAWRTLANGRVKRCFREEDLAHVRKPTAPTVPTTKSPAALLGALGTEIDRARLDVGHIGQESDGFVVTGSLRGMYTTLRFSYLQLQGARPAPSRAMPEAPAVWNSKAVVAPGPDASALRFAKGDTEVIPREETRHVVR
jgi:hypothetical protein